MLFLVPCGANAKIGSPMRKDIESGGDLHQQARITIGNACHQRAQFDTIGAARSKGEGIPALKHLVFGWAKVGELEEVIHHPETVQSGTFGAFSDLAKGSAKTIASIGPGVVGNV